MKVLLVGSGGREHALAWRLSRSRHLTTLWTAGGNSGTAQLGENLPISPDNVDAVVAAASRLGPDLVVIGPEQPLANGLADRLQALGIPAFGPGKAAAQLETSKSFAREVMAEAAIPGPMHRTFHDRGQALEHLAQNPGPVVVKADGLASGKGVTLCQTLQQAVAAVNACMTERVFGPAGDTVVIEELLTGAEVSVFGFTDGKRVSSLVAACDYKPVGDGDQGPNTGGMGCFTPPVFWDEPVAREVKQAIMEPVVAAMAQRGIPYRGMLYAGLMFTQSGPRVLEFNCRFGDPEAQVILPLLESDPIEVMTACIEGSLTADAVQWARKAHVGVVMVSAGYPGPYQTGMEISGLERHEADTLVFHAGAQLSGDGSGRPLTAGGRVVTVVGRGESISQARQAAYRRVAQLDFAGASYRRDIGDLTVGRRGGW